MSLSLTSFKQQLQSGFFGFWIRQWRITFLVLGLMVLIGISSVITIPKESSPEVQIGAVVITTVYPGGNPKEIDQFITEKIEKKIKNLEGVKKVRSTSLKNLSSLVVELNDNADTSRMSSIIRDEVQQVQLPENAEPPKVVEVTMKKNQLFTLMLYAHSPTMNTHYLKERATLLKQRLEGKSGIDTIEIEGGHRYDFQILVHQQKLERLGLSLHQIAKSIQASIANTPLGNHQIGTMNYDFRIQGEITSKAELLALPIPLGKGKTIPLSQIAEVKKVYQDQDQLVHIGKAGDGVGKLAVSLQFTKKSGASILKASTTAKQALMTELEKPEYAGLGSFYTMDVGAYIEEDYDKLANNGLTTLLIVFLIVLVFVGAVESFIATLSIPLAFFVTFFVLKTMGLSLNFLTNFSLIICLGIAIDTATVIIQGASENIKAGYRPMHAALLSVKTYRNSLISGTATTVVVFLPMLTLPSVMGKFLAYIPTTIFITLLASLFISLTITPALFFKLSKDRKQYEKDPQREALASQEEQALLAEERSKKSETLSQDQQGLRDRIFLWIITAYEKKLIPLLTTSKTRIITILIPLILLILTVFFVSPQLGFLMMPATDTEYLTLNLSAREGTTTPELAKKIQEVDQILGSLPELANYTMKLQDHKATILLRIVPKQKRKRDSFMIEHALEEKLNFLSGRGIRVETALQQSGPKSGAEIGIQLIAENPSQLSSLTQVVDDFKHFLAQVPGTKNVKSTAEESPGEFVFQFSKEQLALLGLLQGEFSSELYFALNGLKAGSIKTVNDTHDIKVKYADFDTTITPEQILNMNIPTKQGQLALGSVGTYHFKPAISKIIRENGNISISVESNLQKNTKAEPIMTALMEYAENYAFPEGVSYKKGGETEENADLLIAMMTAFIFALICIFTILVLQFNSYTQPGIILYSVVMGFLGATYGMRITGNPYGMLFLIGFIALTGIVVNNAIILIDSANEKCKQGESRANAMKESAKSRLKPILSTTLTTVIGLATLTTDSFFAPLAWTIIFGLSIATLMTLFVIPALYEDEKIIKYLLARWIVKPLLYLLFPALGLGGIWLFCFSFSIPLFSSEFAQSFSLAFLLTSVLMLSGYSIQCTLKGGTGLIEKFLHLQLVSCDGNPVKKRQMVLRILRKRGLILFPFLGGGIISLVGKLIHLPWISSLGLGGSLIGIGIILLGNLYTVWTNERRQTRRDKKSGIFLKEIE